MKITKNLIIHFVANILLIFFIALAYFWKGSWVGIVGSILAILIGVPYIGFWIMDIYKNNHEEINEKNWKSP